ncbi:MAG: GTP cyclohydrolase I FolE [Polyangiales bacterium]
MTDRKKPLDTVRPDAPNLERSDAAREQAHELVRGMLAYLGENPAREGLLETPARVVRAWDEHFGGYQLDPAEYLAKTFEEVEGYDELVLVSDIEVMSHCEHHMVPFVGKAHVAYIPNGRVVGLSKIARVVDVYAKRLQVQEKLTAQIADALQSHLQPQGVAVIMQCQHFCMCYRGVKKPGSWTTTSKLYGVFLDNAPSRMELFTLIGLKRDIGG